MGTNNLVTKNDGNVAAASDINQYKTALGEDLVPRNSAGVPTDDGGSLGLSSFRWLKGWIKTIRSNLIELGDTSIATIENNSAVLEVRFNDGMNMKTPFGKNVAINDGGLSRDSIANIGSGIDISDDSGEFSASSGDITNQLCTITKAMSNSRVIISSQLTANENSYIQGGQVGIYRDTGSGYSLIAGRFVFGSDVSHKMLYFVDTYVGTGTISYKLSVISGTCNYRYQKLCVREEI